MKPAALIPVLLTPFLALVPAAIFAHYTQNPDDHHPTESLRESVKKQVAEELSQIRQAVAKKGFVGTISAKSDGTITITNLKNAPRVATVTADATIKISSGKDGTPADLKVGDFVIAMGDVDSNNLMFVKRLLVIAKPAPDPRTSIFGAVTKVATGSLTLETLDKKSITVKLQSATKYTGKSKSSDIKTGDKVAIIGPSTSDTSLTARVIHIFTQ